MQLRLVSKIGAAICLFLFSSFTVQAAPIRSLPGLAQVVIYEASGVFTPLFYNIGNPIGDAVLNVKLDDPLTLNPNGNNDYQSNASELYDFFFSDADGSFNIDGAYLTITARFDTNPNAPDSGLNIDAVALIFDGPVTEWASSVLSYSALGLNPFPDTRFNALGENDGVVTFLGDTTNLDETARLSLTLGFDSSAPSAVPVPAAVWLFGTALIGLVGFSKRRKLRI